MGYDSWEAFCNNEEKNPSQPIEQPVFQTDKHIKKAVNAHWHNDGDSAQMMPTITEHWEPDEYRAVIRNG